MDDQIINKVRATHGDQRDISSKYIQKLVAEINSEKFDSVHIHHEEFFHISKNSEC